MMHAVNAFLVPVTGLGLVRTSVAFGYASYWWWCIPEGAPPS